MFFLPYRRVHTGDFPRTGSVFFRIFIYGKPSACEVAELVCIYLFLHLTGRIKVTRSYNTTGSWFLLINKCWKESNCYT